MGAGGPTFEVMGAVALSRFGNLLKRVMLHRAWFAYVECRASAILGPGGPGHLTTLISTSTSLFCNNLVAQSGR